VHGARVHGVARPVESLGISAGTPTSALGLGSRPPHPHRDRARSATSAVGLGADAYHALRPQGWMRPLQWNPPFRSPAVSTLVPSCPSAGRPAGPPAGPPAPGACCEGLVCSDGRSRIDSGGTDQPQGQSGGLLSQSRAETAGQSHCGPTRARISRRTCALCEGVLHALHVARAACQPCCLVWLCRLAAICSGRPSIVRPTLQRHATTCNTCNTCPDGDRPAVPRASGTRCAAQPSHQQSWG
jgi:hypothetical protein